MIQPFIPVSDLPFPGIGLIFTRGYAPGQFRFRLRNLNTVLLPHTLHIKLRITQHVRSHQRFHHGNQILCPLIQFQ